MSHRIDMSYPSFDEDEVEEAIDSLRSGNLTMGAKVARFEKLFADYIGSRHAIMVNSGSTANLLMMSVLTNPLYRHRLYPGDEVIVPALTWSTTLWPVIQMGLFPVLVDCKLDTLCLDPNKVEEAITSKTRAIFVAHILGNSADMDAMRFIADKNNLVLIEDACESLGTKYRNQNVGTFGVMGSYSFYFSHHITTIEGGMIVTDDDDTADMLKCMRAHGWTRHMDDKSVEKDHPDIDPRFMFVNLGYSVRPTEIQGAFGIHQIRKLDYLNTRRRSVAFRFMESVIGGKFTVPEKYTYHTWFGIPIFVDDRKAFCEHMEDMNIATRPIVAGNLASHPAMKIFPYAGENLENAQYAMDHGVYLPCHPNMTADDIQYMARCVR